MEHYKTYGNSWYLKKGLIIFFSLFLALFLAGCASLPDRKEVSKVDETHRAPEIKGPHGNLPPQTSKAIIENIEKKAGPTDILQQNISLIQAITGRPLVAGNKVTLLVDGPATYASMFQAILNAHNHINFETYIFEDDEVGQHFADLLLQKAREGVQVNLIYDSVGSIKTPPSFFERLREGGVQTLEFNPINPLKTKREWLLNQRDHRKVLIVDGGIAFTGGVNISEVYTKSPSRGGSSGITSGFPYSTNEPKEPQKTWRDTHVRIEGPAVAEFQKLFLETWRKEKGPELSKGNYFPSLKPQGKDLVEVVGSTPETEEPITYLMYLSAFTHATKSIHLTSSYMIPNKETIKALTDAAKRGVDVKIVLPGYSDVGAALYAGRSNYTTLLKSGIKLYQRREAVLHAKTAVIDGVWSTVGSTNMDLWSFIRDDEVNAVVLGQDFANKMEEMFTKDLEDSNPVLMEEWEKRSLGERLREWMWRVVSYWL